MEEKKSWLEAFTELAIEFSKKTEQLSDNMANMPHHEVSVFLRRHADATIGAFRSAQSALFRILDLQEHSELELIRSLFLEMSRRFDEMQALFFAALEGYDEKKSSEISDE
ncbi:MAG: hypothetical protein WHS38_04835 [Thermodesulforhabdaceae bacterium]|jgi:hypothetical protein